MSRRARQRRDKRAPQPDFDDEPRIRGFFNGAFKCQKTAK